MRPSCSFRRAIFFSMSKATVVSATIETAKGIDDIDFLLRGNGGSALATLELSDATTETFGWFHDEISYSEQDFVGKTMAEIREMHFERDMQYLRS